MRCPACSEDRTVGDFIAGLCLDCFSAGKPLPIGSLEPLTTRTLVRVGRGLRDTVNPDATGCDELHQRKEVETMGGETKACRHCGKVMPKGSLYAHERVRCEKRPANGDAQPARGAAKPQPKVQRTSANGEDGYPVTRSSSFQVVPRPSSLPEPHGDTAQRVVTNGHCVDCLFRGLERHIDQDLVRRAVVGGMNLQDACVFVREAKVALGSAS